MNSTINDLKAALSLQREIVGIKFLYSESNYIACKIKPVKDKLSYCKMISLASKGFAFKVDLEHSACEGAINALGMKSFSNETIQGQSYYNLGMYNNIGVAKKTQNTVAVMRGQIYGVSAMPLASYTEHPDVVLIFTTPYSVMRIIQGYTYHYGVTKNIMFSGNQGVCLECTANPFETQDINVSALCSNTRFLAQWCDDEMGIGIPYSMFEKVVDGVIKTLNSSETDERKLEVEKNCSELGCEFPIIYGENYYLKKSI